MAANLFSKMQQAKRSKNLEATLMCIACNTEVAEAERAAAAARRAEDVAKVSLQ